MEEEEQREVKVEEKRELEKSEWRGGAGVGKGESRK